MTEYEMSTIINRALDSYAWGGSHGVSLPAYIATAIADAQPEPHPDHDDNPVIIALRRRLEEAKKEVDAKEEHKKELRAEIERLKNSVDFLRREEKASAENVSRRLDEVEDLKAIIAKIKALLS